MEHVEGRGDLKQLTESREAKGWQLAKPERRVVHESARKWGTVDTEDVHETSRVKDGHVVTETERTTQHEKYENQSLPDSGSSLSDGSVHEEARQTQHNIVHTKDEDLVEYYGVPRGGTLAQGVKLGEGMHVVSEDFHEDREGEELESLSERLRRARLLGSLKPKARDTPERTDALTRRPLDYHQEEATRKSETSRWLENHFGSESGRSGSSSHDDAVQTSSGGNIITITMSPRPASTEDVPDEGLPPRWRSSSPPVMASFKGPPPPPPAKPSPLWTPSSSAPAPAQQPPVPDEITDSMIAAARARLRSTGRILDASNQPASLPVSSSSAQVSSPTGASCRTASPLDPIVSSRFRSGSPGGYLPSKFFPTSSRNSRPSPPDSPPPPLPATPPPPQQTSNVGRSQSFNAATKNWMNCARRTPKSQLECRSEEQLDAVGHGKRNEHWPSLRRQTSPELDGEPNPPPRSRTSNTPYYNTTPSRSAKSNGDLNPVALARDSGTQTDLSPVPPPRTKRKQKPRTYYFGEESLSSTMGFCGRPRPAKTSTEDQVSPKVERRVRAAKAATSTASGPDRLQKGLKNHAWHYRSMDELSSAGDLGGEAAPPRSSWTNTVDPRRRPRRSANEAKDTTKTLPKKVANGGPASPSKTYIFGDDGTACRKPLVTSSYLRSKGGSMINVSLAGMSSPKTSVPADVPDHQPPLKITKPVIRSHSLNVRAAPLSVPASASTPAPSLAAHQRTNNMYRSSPFLRSPNLISTIARSNSTRRTTDHRNGLPQGPESPGDFPPSSRSPLLQQVPVINGHDSREEEKRAKFMKGLLTSAPELYHFIHGDDNNKGGQGVAAETRESPNPPESPPMLIRPPGSPGAATSPPTSTAPKIFTFGRGDPKRPTSTDHRPRFTSAHFDNSSPSNLRENTTSGRNSLSSQYHRNALLKNSLNSGTSSLNRPKFNLKSPNAGSILYSTSFRSRLEPSPPPASSSTWRSSDSNQTPKWREETENSRRKVSNLSTDGPVLIPIRDWNSR